MGQRFPALSVKCTWWKLFFTLLVLSCAQTESSSHSVFFFFLLIDHILFTQVKHTPLAEKDNTTEQPPPLVWLSISQPWNDSQDYSRTFYSLSDSVHELLSNCSSNSSVCLPRQTKSIRARITDVAPARRFITTTSVNLWRWECTSQLLLCCS